MKICCQQPKRIATPSGFFSSPSAFCSLFPAHCSLFLLLTLFAACATSPASTASPLLIPDDIAGIVHAGRTRTLKEYAYLNQLNVKWVSFTFSWIDIEPEQGEWDFLVHDATVDRLRAEGIKIMGTLAYDAWWIYDDKDTHRNITSTQLPHYLEYVKQTVEHFKGRVDAWCIWNEPNTKHFWKGTMEDFFALTKEAAKVAKETDPDATILGGAFNRNVPGLSEKFIRGLFESGAMEKVDAVAFHPYELNPARTLRLYDLCKKILADYNFENKIWVTEVGYPTGGWYPTKIAEKKMPEYAVKTFINLAAAGAQKILWYQLFDPVNRKRDNSEDFFGLVRSRRDYASKGAEAFRLCSVYLAGTEYRPDLPQKEGLPDSLRTFYFEKPDGGGAVSPGGTLVLWKENGSVKVKLQNLNGFVHDPVSGRAAAVSGETLLKVGTMPVFITWEGDQQPRLASVR